MSWNINNVELYAKVKKENPLSRALQRNGFKFAGSRGKEILLCRKPKKETFKVDNKDTKGEK